MGVMASSLKRPESDIPIPSSNPIPEAKEPLPKPEPPKPEPASMKLLEANILERVISFLGYSSKYVTVNQNFSSIIGAKRRSELDDNIAEMKELAKTVYNQFLFAEKWSIHRSSPLVNTLRVVDREIVEGRELKSLGEDDVLEQGVIVPLRKQTQLSNMAETWRGVGLSSEKTEIFETTFENLWEKLNLKRWIDRTDIIWIDESSSDVSELVKKLFETLRDIRKNVAKYQEIMNKCMWHLRAQEHAKFLEYEKKKKKAARKRELDMEKRQKAGAFIMDYAA